MLENKEFLCDYVGVAKGDLFTKVVSSVGNEYENNSSMYGQVDSIDRNRHW